MSPKNKEKRLPSVPTNFSLIDRRTAENNDTSPFREALKFKTHT